MPDWLAWWLMALAARIDRHTWSEVQRQQRPHYIVMRRTQVLGRTLTEPFVMRIPDGWHPARYV